MKRKTLAITIIAVLIAGAAISIAFSQAQEQRGRMTGNVPVYGTRMGFGRGPRMEGIAPIGLDLEKEQLEKLQTLRTDFFKETVELRNELQIKALELRQLWLADELDDDAIIIKSEEISELKNQLQEKRTQHHLDVAKVLTKEQRANFFQYRGMGRGNFGQRGMRPGRNGRRFRGRGFNFGMGPCNW